jgi:hypothetical protein
MDTTGEKEKRTPKENVEGRSTSSHETRNLEPDQWRNREEWRLVSGRQRLPLKNTRWIDRGNVTEEPRRITRMF